MEYTEKCPVIEDYYLLYLETGWNENLRLNKKEVAKAVQRSFITISVYQQTQLIGFGRVISDGVVYAGIYDVMVKPEFQHHGIGSEIVKRLIKKCQSANIRSIHLFAAKYAESFYQKLGFVNRPLDMPGMKYEPNKS